MIDWLIEFLIGIALNSKLQNYLFITFYYLVEINSAFPTIIKRELPIWLNNDWY